ncbi:hypothetical protein [Actinosynnema sp. NPDC020468]|uniref:hypothetical protein n=1 Tax=Actinosynnema sp. NPDC020468 TaxID=3154488 RepID=UPI0033DAFFF9
MPVTGGAVAFVLGLCALSFALGCVVTAYMLRRPEPVWEDVEDADRLELTSGAGRADAPGKAALELVPDPSPEQDHVVELRARTLMARLAEHEAAARLAEQGADEECRVVSLPVQPDPEHSSPTRLPKQSEPVATEQPKPAG